MKILQLIGNIITATKLYMHATGDLNASCLIEKKKVLKDVNYILQYYDNINWNLSVVVIDQLIHISNNIRPYKVFKILNN